MTAAADVRRGRPGVRADSGDMCECFHACLPRKQRDAPGGLHVDRLKCAISVLDIKTDGVHDCPGTADGSRHRGLVVCVRTNSFDVRNVAGKQQAAPLRMPRGDPNDEIGVVQMADNAATEKAGAAKYRDALRRHDVITGSSSSQSGHRRTPANSIKDRVQPMEGAQRARFVSLIGQLTANPRMLRIACRPSQ